MKKLISVLLIFIPEILFAANKEWKPGYVVTTQNDTIEGYIAYRKSMEDQEKCLFKKDMRSPEFNYTPNELISYRYDDGLCFQSKNIKTAHLNGKYFVECLLEGIINLYCAQVDYSKEMDDRKSFGPIVSAFLAEIPEEDSWVEIICPTDIFNDQLESKRNDKKLTILFINQIEKLKNDIPKSSYNRDKMIALFKKYHDLVCTDKDCVIYKEPHKRPSQFLTCFTSFGFQKRRATDILDPEQENFLCPMVHVGVTYSHSLNKFTDRLRLNVALGLFYLNAKKNTYYNKIFYHPGYEFTDNEGNVTGPKTYHDIEYHYLFRTLGIYNQISVEGRLMAKKKIQPLLEIGLYQQVYIPVKNKLDISVRELGHNINSMEYPHYIVGIIASVGISINKEKYQIPIKINTYLPFTESIDRPMELRTQFSLSIGYTFSIGKNNR
ncbi:hypothetical protein [Coprobacter sp.]|uniref:hypothetical protein n=1 Tax=Coprobacter sp. TaxID=1941478 RepID=UPI003AB5268F